MIQLGSSTYMRATNGGGQQNAPQEQDALLPPNVIRPVSYDVVLALTGPSGFYVEGIVEITVEIGQALSSFLLHASGITISSAMIVPHGPKASVLQVSRQMVSVSFPHTLPVGVHVLRMSFSLSIGVNRTDGIYACTWRNQPNNWIVATHFEPANCRSAFPCFDQPHFKATHRLTIITRHLPTRAISNTEEEFSGSDKVIDISRLGEAGASLINRIRGRGNATTSSGTNTEGGNGTTTLHITRFKPTPPLSTYVLGFWVGEFSDVNQVSDTGAMVTVYLPPDRVEEGGFARDVAVKSFDFFSRLFEVPFPLPKLEIICLPQMHGVGMEGFGAVTIIQDYLLVSDTTDFVRRRRIMRLLCHEISHQWFGDIVTPHSFDELWLKESTARLFEYIAVHSLEPDWRIWPNFVAEVTYMAMLADASPSSHPVVQQHHGNIRSIIESFDVITYGKGASILRMLAEHLGMEVFVAGMKRFMTSFQYRNASKEDLWVALQEESTLHQAARRNDMDYRHQQQQHAEEEGVSVSKLMEPWLARAGCPALHVEVRRGANGLGPPQLVLSQRPFNLVGTTKLSIVDPGKQRCIPLRIRVGRTGDEVGQTLKLLVGEGPPVSIDLSPYLGLNVPQNHQQDFNHRPHKEVDAWLVINDKQSGFFTSVYDSHESWSMVRKALENGHMSEVEAVGLVCDLMLGIQAAMKADNHSNSIAAVNGLGLLLTRLTELVRLLSKDRESPSWCICQVFLWDIELVSLLKETEECEEQGGVAPAVAAGGEQQQQGGGGGAAVVNGDTSATTTANGKGGKKWMNKMKLQSKSSTTPHSSGSSGAITHLLMMRVENLSSRVHELVSKMEAECYWAETRLGHQNVGSGVNEKDVLMESLHKLRAVRAKALKLAARVGSFRSYVASSLAPTTTLGPLAAGVDSYSSPSSASLSHARAIGGVNGGGNGTSGGGMRGMYAAEDYDAGLSPKAAHPSAVHHHHHHLQGHQGEVFRPRMI